MNIPITERPLTARQQEFVGVIRDFWREHGYGPTVREIAAALGIRSPHGVVSQLQPIRRRGIITWEKNTARSIRLVAPGPPPAPAPDPADVRELVDAARAMYRELSAHYADFDFDAWSENWRYGEERHPAEIAIRMAAKALAKFPEGE